MDPNILQSLQEIASLLLMIHDVYLKDVIGSDILVALVSFLQDTQLNVMVSILDAEKLRRKVMRNGESNLGYELFYEWLRAVGELVYKADEMGGKKALQYLLTQHILPFASTMNGRSHPIYSINLPYYTESALEVMTQHADFLYLWFLHVSSQTEEHSSIWNNGENNQLWKAVSGTRIDADRLVRSLICCGLVASDGGPARRGSFRDVCAVTSSDLESILLLVGSGGADESDEAYSNLPVSQPTLNFPSFLYLLELVSERTSSFSSSRQGIITSRGQHSLLTLLQNVAAEMLLGVAGRVAEADRLQVSEGDEGEPMDALRPPAVLRWLRQSGLVRLGLVDVPWLYQQLTIYADYDCSFGDPHVWRVDRLPFVFSRLLEKVAALSNTNGFRSGGESEGEHIVGLLRVLPRLFFHEDSHFPPGAQVLYNALPGVAASWREVADREFALFFEKITPLVVWDKADSIDWMQRLGDGLTGGGDARLRSDCCPSVAIADLVLFFAALPRLHAVVPQLLDERLMCDICSSVLGLQTQGGEKVLVPRNCLLEVLFAFVFNYLGVVEPALCGETGEAPLREDDLTGDQQFDEVQYCQRVFELLARLISFILVCVEQSVEVVRPPPVPAADTHPLSASALIDSLPADQHDVHNNSVAIASSGVASSHSVAEEEEEQHPMREVAVLLAHYPLASFALSPWDVAQLCSLGDYNMSSGSSEPPSGGGGGLSLTDLLRAFSSKFSVSIADLSNFFAEYYTTSPESTAAQSDAKRQALRSPTMSLFMVSRTLRLLHLNSDLLKWEFGRCLARYRAASDPFTEGVLLPFAADHDPLAQQMTPDGEKAPAQSNLLISHAAATAWAVAHGFKSAEAESYLRAIACLTGETLIRGYLTFSTFMSFAVRCFTQGAVASIAAAPREEDEDRFVEHIRRMLHVFSQNLSSVQQSMQVRVLRLLFAPLGEQSSSGGGESCEKDCAPVLQASLALFDRFVTSSSAGPTSGAVSPQLLPPRPPAALWDPPRFVGYCKHLGILSGYEFSVEMAWVAYGLCLRELSPRTAQVWDTDFIVPPVPVLIGEANSLDKLCRCLLLLASSVDRGGDIDSPGEPSPICLTELCFKTITPVVCMSVDMLRDDSGSSVPRQKHSVGGEYPLLEDVLRYGGSEAVGSLSACQDFLLMSYCALSEQSRLLLMSPFSNCRGDSFQCEASLNLVCKFFASSVVLRMGTIAVQAKRSLQSRLRPVYHNTQKAAGSGPPPEAVTMCFAEFEELFLRCAFALWEGSGALSHSAHMPSEEALLRGSQSSSSIDQSADIFRAARQYVEECRLLQATKRGGRGKTGKRDSWGVDFVAPFASILRYQTSTTTGPFALLDESLLDSRRTRCSSFLDSSVVLEVAPQSIVRSECVDSAHQGGVLLDILSSSRLQYSIADPATRRRDELRASPEGGRRLGAEDSTKQQLHTSQQVISSSSERVQLLQESSEQFVVALDSLLMGSKEALWPVYATYCSCGDSSDPGKLSGPNLFTLLSKLGVLTDRTLLSDVGVLLHQTSTHSFCTAAAGSTVATLISGTSGKSPSLTFEEFLVFLCAFSRLRFEGLLLTPHDMGAQIKSDNPENWFRQWQQFMGSSKSFRRLLSESILPVLKKHTLLAFPEDARLRDRFACVFSVEVLTAIEGAEGPLQQFFRREMGESLDMAVDRQDGRFVNEDSVGIAGIVAAMKRIRLVPNVVQESQVLQLIEDVLPERRLQRSKAAVNPQNGGERLLFPQWEWVLSVVAYQAVETAIQQSEVFSTSEKIPALVADVVTSISSAMAAGHN